MTLKRATYNLCKAIIRAPKRNDIKNLIHSLNTITDPSKLGDSDRTIFGYVSRQQRAQYYGYLLVDQERVRLANEAIPISVPPLLDEERLLLSSAHSEIGKLNDACTLNLTTAYPYLSNAVDPYGKLIKLDERAISEHSIFPSEIFNDTISAFNSHPLLKLALSIAKKVMNQPDPNEVSWAVNDLESTIWKAGPGVTPDNIISFTRSEPLESMNRVGFRLTAALLSIRASLRVLNQMIYQASLNDKLPILDQDNLIQLEHLGNSYTGIGMRAVYQPSEKASFIEVGDLALLKPLSAEIPLDGLMLVESTSSSFSQEYGQSDTVSGRIVDDNLNPYQGLTSWV